MHDLLWTFPVIIAASLLIGWAAEVMAVYLSAGIALAVLAWLQTSPEFAVEATIAWHRDAHLALANLTGSLRLLLGLGWPMVMFIHFFKTKRKTIHLPLGFSVEAGGLLGPILYFVWIYFREKWTFWDGVVLCGFYGFYFWLLNKQRKAKLAGSPPLEEEDEPWVVRKITHMRSGPRVFAILAIFGLGGAALIFSVHPFVEALKEAAMQLGMSQFVFIQWVAPIASEFPEKVTAFNWARKSSKVPMAIVNMISSVTSQWTLLAGLIPILFSVFSHELVTLDLTPFQRMELLLTIAQSLLAVLLLSDLKIHSIEAVGIFLLWLVQLFVPEAHKSAIVLAYFAWIALEVGRMFYVRDQLIAWRTLGKILRG